MKPVPGFPFRLEYGAISSVPGIKHATLSVG